MITEIFVENKKLDVSKDLDSLITFAIDDIKDFSARSTTFSKTIVIPGTANNNAIFGNIFETGISNDFDPALDNVGYNFNASKAARCIIFQDNLQTFKGTLRMLEIDKDRNTIEYEVALNGEITSLSVALSSGFLTDLDFSAYNLTYDAPTISASWDNTPGTGVYFPLIDYGTYSVNKHDWDYLTFRPALYAKEYIDKMFSAANFRYTADLFDTDRFKRLVIPHNQKQLLSETSIALSAAKSSNQIVLDSAGPTFSIGTWDGFIGGGFAYSAGQFTYTAPTTLTTNIAWRIGGVRTAGTGSFRISIRKSGVTIASTIISLVPFTVNYNWQSSVTGVTIATGDVIDVYFEIVSGASVHVTFQDNPATLDITSTTTAFLPVNYGQTITVNDAIPKNIRQVDFLVSIVKSFNLYVYESQFDERLILIKPFIDFYSTDSSAARDWTHKMNRNKPVKIKPLSEVNSKIYNFNFKSDSDYYNDLYKKRYNQTYGSYIFDSEFDFASQTNTLELIFSSTPLVGYDLEEKVYPTIFKRSGTVEETIDSNIRILQTKKVLGVTAWTIKSGATVRGTYMNYGYGGHFDDPDNPSNDLNFGALNELFFVLVGGDLSNTQFNLYWSAYMAEITDKDSKLLTAKFYLTPKDIFDLDFSKYIFIDGVLFRLNKITDYNATIPSDCEIELLRVINTAYTFAPPIIPETFRWLDADNSFVLDFDNSKILHQ